MKKVMKFLKDKNLVLDTINVIVGVILLVFIILIFINPTNTAYLLGAILLGGFMNVTNGLKQMRMKDKTKKNMGMSMIMLGAIIMIFGIFLVNII